MLRAPDADDLAGARLVFIALGDLDQARRIGVLARAAGAQVNVVDQPALSDFQTPALIDRDEVVVAWRPADRPRSWPATSARPSRMCCLPDWPMWRGWRANCVRRQDQRPRLHGAAPVLGKRRSADPAATLAGRGADGRGAARDAAPVERGGAGTGGGPYRGRGAGRSRTADAEGAAGVAGRGRHHSRPAGARGGCWSGRGATPSVCMSARRAATIPCRKTRSRP